MEEINSRFNRNQCIQKFEWDPRHRQVFVPLRWWSSPPPERSPAAEWQGSAASQSLWGSVPACQDYWSEKVNSSVKPAEQCVRSSVKLQYLTCFWRLLIFVWFCTHRFHPVSDAHNEFAVFLHFVDKLHRQHAAVERLAELLSSCVQGASKTVPLNTNRASDETLLFWCYSDWTVGKSVVFVRWWAVLRSGWRSGLCQHAHTLWCYELQKQQGRDPPSPSDTSRWTDKHSAEAWNTWIMWKL